MENLQFQIRSPLKNKMFDSSYFSIFFNFICYEVQSFIITINLYIVLFMVLKDYNINHTMYMYFRNYIHDDYSCYFIKNVVDFVDCAKQTMNFKTSLVNLIISVNYCLKVCSEFVYYFLQLLIKFHIIFI